MTELNLDKLREQYKDEYGNLNVNLNELITQEKRKKGVTSKNRDAMNHLYKIVGTSNLRQDISRVRGAQTLAGAQNWIKTNKKEDFYNAIEEDVDNDGINDVIIKDVEGNLVVVNGYTVKKSDYPSRKMYLEAPPEDRRDYRNHKDYFMDAYYQPVYDGDSINIESFRGIDPNNDPYTKQLKAKGFKTNIPKSRSPYQFFASQFVKQMYNYTIDRFNLRTQDGKKPNVYIKLLSIVWNELVITPVLQTIFGNNANIEGIMKNPKVFNKLKANKDYKQLIINIVNNYFLAENAEYLVGYIRDVTFKLCEDWYENTGKVKQDDYGRENEEVKFPTIAGVTD